MDAAYRELLDEAATCAAFETLLSGKGGRSAGRSKRRGAGCGGRAGEPLPDPTAAAVAAVRAVVGTLAKARKRPPPSEPMDDAALSKMARFADRFALADYAPFLWYVPRIVNVVRHTPCGGCPHSSHRHAPVAGFPGLAGHAGRGGARARLGPHAATQPARDRLQVQRMLLRSEAIRRRPVSICQPARTRADFSYVTNPSTRSASFQLT